MMFGLLYVQKDFRHVINFEGVDFRIVFDMRIIRMKRGKQL